ncbi:MAG: DUF1304 domain-containing protein [Microbacteriaceae bacterium]|nr:DUF1304 domain-containing protein [Microbacteriaceae bacterium]
MTILITLLAVLAAVLHFVFFYMESLAFQNPAVWKRFGVKTQEEAEIARPWALNLGFYNLFLGLGVLAGALVIGLGLAFAQPAMITTGTTLLIFGLSFMLAASIVLLVKNRRMLVGALIQGLLPLAALLLILVQWISG